MIATNSSNGPVIELLEENIRFNIKQSASSDVMHFFFVAVSVNNNEMFVSY